MFSWTHYMDQWMFGILPFVAILVFLIVSIQRYRAKTFTFSSLSSQFLENKRHFLGMVPFHYGILTVLAGHLIAFAIPRSILAWNQIPLRLYVLEISALIAGLLTLIGFVSLIVRRFADPKIRVVTSKADVVLYFLLLAQILSGVLIAIFHPWGSNWFAAVLSPYLWSLLKFQPDVSFVTSLPMLIKFHIVNAFVIIAFFPFTRLVHILVIPNMYLWRKTQVVRWYKNAPKEVA